MEEKLRYEKIGGITLDLMFWDCECLMNYIHPNIVSKCPICGAKKEDSPNSRANEVECVSKEN